MTEKSQEMAVSFERLSEDECYKLLGAADFGHLGVIKDNYPLIFPVNYGLDNRAIVIRTAKGTKFDTTLNDRVSFEVEDVDRFHQRAWSVMAKGRAFHSELEGDAHPQSMIPGAKPAVIRIVIEEISGRRLTQTEEMAFDGHGYL